MERGDERARALSAAASAAATPRGGGERRRAGSAAPLGAQLLALAAPLLDACAGSVLSAAPGSSARAKARAEYVAARETVLTALLEAARAGRSAGGRIARRSDRPGSLPTQSPPSPRRTSGTNNSRKCARQRRSRQSPRGIRTRSPPPPRGYIITCERCAALSADGEGTFAAFMFERMMSHPGYRGGVGQRVAEMLQNTPEEFHDELKACLEPRPPLLWLHQLRSEDYDGTAATRSRAQRDRRPGRGSATLAERRRYLSLAKLSLLADGVSSSSDDVIAIDAALDLAAIQSRLARAEAAATATATRPCRRFDWSRRALTRARARGVPGARKIFSTRSRRSHPRERRSGRLTGPCSRYAGEEPRRRRTGRISLGFANQGGHSVRAGAQRHVRRSRGKTVLRRICGASRRAVLGGVENQRGAEAAGGCAGGRRVGGGKGRAWVVGPRRRRR